MRFGERNRLTEPLLCTMAVCRNVPYSLGTCTLTKSNGTQYPLFDVQTHHKLQSGFCPQCQVQNEYLLCVEGVFANTCRQDRDLDPNLEVFINLWNVKIGIWTPTWTPLDFFIWNFGKGIFAITSPQGKLQFGHSKPTRGAAVRALDRHHAIRKSRADRQGRPGAEREEKRGREREGREEDRPGLSNRRMFPPPCCFLLFFFFFFFRGENSLLAFLFF